VFLFQTSLSPRVLERFWATYALIPAGPFEVWTTHVASGVDEAVTHDPEPLRAHRLGTIRHQRSVTATTAQPYASATSRSHETAR